MRYFGSHAPAWELAFPAPASIRRWSVKVCIPTLERGNEEKLQ